ncbi:MAG: hypothetical protein JRI68_13650 [Deltaproteobacteria bacterium]|nr:hypothetical protein [Deltaproteobacteria bacterium]
MRPSSLATALGALLIAAACSVVNAPDDVVDPGAGGSGTGGSTSSSGSGGDAGSTGDCGDGVVDDDAGETCDPPSSCPDEQDCITQSACADDSLIGDADQCTAECVSEPITACLADTDSCCPDSCSGLDDIDCAECGNDTVELGETCDGDCPQNCNDSDPCTADAMSGNVGQCTAVCSNDPITQCTGGDGCCPSSCAFNQDSDCLFSQPSYPAAQTFTDGLTGTTMTMAWDGTSYWSCSGGNTNGVRLAQYNATGTVIGTYSPGIDFRSVLTKGDGTTPVYARGYGSNQVLVQTAPGTFGNDVTLTGGTLDSQGRLVWDDTASEFVTQYGGTVNRWSATGAFLGTVPLSGFGTQFNENGGEQTGCIATSSGLYFTYSEGNLSAWDTNGTRLKTTQLVGAGTGYDAYYGFSYANGMFWVNDAAGGTWRGYDVSQ